MPFIVSLSLFSIIALFVYNVMSYLHATGTVWDRLAYCWAGSMTLCTLIWTSITTIFVGGADYLSQITGDPQFTTVAIAVKDVIGPEWAPWIGVLTLALPLILGTLSRHRTNPE